MLESTIVVTAATATKTAVQVPCDERELRLMEIPSMPDPEVNV